MSRVQLSRRVRVCAVAAALVLSGFGASSPAAGRRDPTPGGIQLVRVSTPTWAARDRLTGLGLDLTEHGGPDFVEVVLHGPADADRLRDAGFQWTVRIADLVATAVENRRADARYAASVASSPLPSGRDAYRTLADYDADLAALASRHRGLVRAFSLKHPSVDGRPINGVEISENVDSTSDGKPVFLLMGLHHAREWPSGEHTIEFAFDLAKNYGTDPRITSLLRRARVLVVPVVNPDGFDESRTWGELLDLRSVDNGGAVTFAGPGNAYKRKNCRGPQQLPPIPGACKVGTVGAMALEVGVDLNRNYGALWGGAGASSSEFDLTFHGPRPFSEPESQAVRELVASRQVTMLISNHTYGNLMLRPPGARAFGHTADEKAMRGLGAEMAAQNGYSNQYGWQLYDTTGTTDDWSYLATGGYAYTFEIGPTEFHPPFETVVNEYLGAGRYKGKGNREAYLLALAYAADPQHHAVLSGSGPAGAVLRLKKSFATRTSVDDDEGAPMTVADTLQSSMVVPSDGRFTWHVNPSTRPEVMEHRRHVFAEDPTREQASTHEVAVWTQGDAVDVPFALPESGVGALRAGVEWASAADDLELEVYRVTPDGPPVGVGSAYTTDNPETVLVPFPEPGDYILRVVNYSSISATFTVTAGLYAVVGEETVSQAIAESWTLSCERADGTVLHEQQVMVDRGAMAKVDLSTCAARFAG